MEERAGLLTRGSLPRRLPSPEASGVSTGEQLPLQRRDRPGLSPGSLTALPCGRAAYHRSVPSSRLGPWLPVVLWGAVIFGLSSIPSLGTGLGTWDLILRKLAHVTEYAILGALLARALGRPAVAVGLGALYAVSDEVHQHFVRGRHGAWYDVVIDTCGVVAGVVLWRRLRKGAP